MPQDALAFRTEIQEGAAVVHCSGSLVAGDVDALRTEVKSLFPQAKTVVLDLTGLTRMDSMGLGTIVGLYASAKAAGCNLKMINFGERVRKLLIVTNLLNVFEEYAKYDTRMP